MDIALTLVVNPSKSNSSLIDIVDTAKEILGKRFKQTKVLSNGRATDLFLTADTLAEAQASLADKLNMINGLDWCLQAEAGRRKKLILADMDSTMITAECIDELADFIGLKEKVSEITEAAMRGELNFESALTERVALLKGLPTTKLLECYETRIALMPGARILVQTMKANGAYSALVSGGFTYFTEKVAAEVGFDMNRANILGIEGTALTGTVMLPICGAQTKLDTLQELASTLDLDTSEILAVGDGANDIPMIEAAGLGVAYHAKPKTQAAAKASVQCGDLTALLYFQGYADSDFVKS
ncbi:MAG: phosphoserine phosphatase SerB [Kordiimonadales bacterium]|nr:MAG: phosphoserine phosphatase SerB [Kordiimonadales bacterium]